MTPRPGQNMSIDERNPGRKSLIALDWLNVFLADVRDGLGPYLAIYLLVSHHWDAASIGIAMSAMGVATVIAQTPVGALIDATRHKRALVVIACIFVALACVAMTLVPGLVAIVAAQSVVGIAAAVFPPAVAAISLGIVGPKLLSRRIGRNEAFNHAGNVVAAVLAGLIGFYISYEGIFYLVAGFSLASMMATLRIKETDIDHQLARGATSKDDGISGFIALISDHRLLVFAAAVVLFHFANAAMLPLAGQLLSMKAPEGAALYMSACIIAAQLVMIPVASLTGRLIAGEEGPSFSWALPSCRFAACSTPSARSRCLSLRYSSWMESARVSSACCRWSSLPISLKELGDIT